MDGRIKAIVSADVSQYNKAMRGLGQTASKGMTGATKSVGVGGTHLISRVSRTMSAMSTKVGSVGDLIGSQLIKPFSKAGGGIQRVVSGIARKLPEPFNSAFTTVGTYAGAGATKIGSGFSRVTGYARSAGTMVKTGFGGAMRTVGSAGSAGFGRIRKDFNSVKSGASGSISSMVRFGSVFALLGGTAKVVGNAFARLDTMDQFKRSITAITGETSAADRALDTLKTTTKGTAYGLDSAAKATQGFVTRGMEIGGATKSVEAWMDAVSFYGNGTNEELATVSDAIGKMRTKGVVGMDQLNRMFEVGIDAVGMYAKATGTSASSVQTDLSNGKLSAEQFLGTVEKAMMSGANGVIKVAGSAKSAGTSWSGTFANMGAAATRGMTTIISALDGALGEAGLGSAKENLAKFGSVLETAMGKVAAVIPAAVKTFGTFVDAVKKVGGFLMPLKPLFEAFGGVILGSTAAFAAYGGVLKITASLFKIFSPAITTLSLLFKGIVIVVGLVRKAWLAMNLTLLMNPFVLIIAGIVLLVAGLVWFFTKTETGRAIVTSVWETIKNVTSAIFTFLMNGLTVLGEFMVSVWEGIKAIASTIWEVVQAAWTAFIDAVKSIFTALSSFFTSLWEGIKMVALLIWDAVQAAWTAFIDVVKSVFTALGSFFTSLWEGIKSVATAVWTAITTAITKIVVGYLKAFMAIWKGLATGVKAIWNGIKAAALAIWNGIKKVISGVVTGLSNTIKKIWEVIKTATSTIFNRVKAIASAVWNGLKAVVSGVVNGVKRAVSNAWDSIKTATSRVFNTIKAIAKSVWDGIKGMVSRVVTGIKTAITGAWDTIKGLTSKAFEAIKGFILGPLKAIDLLRIGKDIINGLVNGITSGIEWVKKKIATIAGIIPNWLKKKLGINSPSRVMHALGSYTGEGLVNGLASQQRAVSSQAETFADTIQSQQMEAEGHLMTDTSHLGGRFSRSFDNLSADVKSQALANVSIQVINEWDGERVRTYLKEKDARSTRKITIIGG